MKVFVILLAVLFVTALAQKDFSVYPLNESSAFGVKMPPLLGQEGLLLEPSPLNETMSGETTYSMAYVQPDPDVIYSMQFVEPDPSTRYFMYVPETVVVPEELPLEP